MATNRFDPAKFIRPGGHNKKRDIRRAAQFTDAIQYVGGIMAVTLVDEYGWTVDEVSELVEKMKTRLQKEKAG